MALSLPVFPLTNLLLLTSEVGNERHRWEFLSVQYLYRHTRVLWETVLLKLRFSEQYSPVFGGSQTKYNLSSLNTISQVVSGTPCTTHTSLILHRASWSSYQRGDFKHRPTFCHPAVQTWLWWQDLHFPLAGGGPGEAGTTQSSLLEASA